MAKKVEAFVKLQVPAGQANPSPPVGPALGQHGVNIMDFCKAFNAQTQGHEPGIPIPVVITVYADRTFSFVTKGRRRPRSCCARPRRCRKAVPTPNTVKVGSRVTRAQLEEIAKMKDPDLTAADMDGRRAHDSRKRPQRGHRSGWGSVMTAKSKRMRAIAEKVEPHKVYAVEEAVGILAEVSKTKFGEAVDVSVNLGVDPRKSDQVVRGATHSAAWVRQGSAGRRIRTGRERREGVGRRCGRGGFRGSRRAGQGGRTELRCRHRNAGTPCGSSGPLGRILGPRGMMPNPKTGTVTADVESAVRDAKAGQVQFRTDRAGIIHGRVGKVGFEPRQIRENVEALLADLNKAKPASAKGHYLKKVTLSTTMGPGIPIDQTSLEV